MLDIPYPGNNGEIQGGRQDCHAHIYFAIPSFQLSTPCNNKIFIIIVINNFNTTLATFCNLIHSGRNICEAMIFFKKIVNQILEH